MVDVATLGFAVQTAPLEKGKKSLDDLTTSARKTTVAVDDLGDSLSDSLSVKTTPIDNASQSLDKATTAAKKTTAALDVATGSFSVINNETKKYELEVHELTQAHKLGAINAHQYDAALTALNGRYAPAGAGITKVVASTEKMNRGFASNNARMMALQLSQVAQQTSATGNFIQALAIQLPDLTLGFGVMGIAAGVAAGALLPLIANMVSGGEKAQSMADATDELTEATRAYKAAVDDLDLEALRDQFGNVTVEIVKMQGALVDLRLKQVQLEAQQAAKAIADAFSGGVFSTQATELQSLFNINIGLAGQLASAMQNVGNASGIDNQISAVSELRSRIEAVTGGIENMTAEQAAFYNDIIATESALRAAQGAADGVAGAVGNAADQAARLAATLGAAIGMELPGLQQLNQFNSTPFQNEAEILSERYSQNYADSVAAANRGSGGRRRGGGGASRGASEAEQRAKAYASLVANQNNYIEKLKVETQAVGMADQAARAMVIAQDLMTQAQANNAQLTPKQTQELLALADATAAAEIEAEKAKEAFGFARDLAGGFFSDLKNGLQNGESFWDSFKNAALNALDKITDRLLNQVLDAIFQVNSAGSASGGGFGFLGQIFGSLFGGFRASGGPVSAGTPYIVGERGPEVFVPGTYGNVMSNKSMTASGPGGGGLAGLHITVGVSADSNGNLMPFVESVAEKKANAAGQQARQGAVNDVKSNMPTWSRQTQTYGRPA